MIADDATAAVIVNTTIQIQFQRTSNNSQAHKCEEKSAKEEFGRKDSWNENEEKCGSFDCPPSIDKNTTED
jgi:hypothetical protein